MQGLRLFGQVEKDTYMIYSFTYTLFYLENKSFMQNFDVHYNKCVFIKSNLLLLTKSRVPVPGMRSRTKESLEVHQEPWDIHVENENEHQSNF